MVKVVIKRYLFPKKPPINLLKTSPPEKAELIKPASFVETVTMVKAIATAKAISFKEISLAPQYFAAIVLF